jgi:hypothetical protein
MDFMDFMDDMDMDDMDRFTPRHPSGAYAMLWLVAGGKVKVEENFGGTTLLIPYLRCRHRANLDLV